MIKEELLEVIVCPKCRKSIRLSNDKKYIVCDNCKLLYEINNNIPVMLIDNAIKKDDIENI